MKQAIKIARTVLVSIGLFCLLGQGLKASTITVRNNGFEDTNDLSPWVKDGTASKITQDATEKSTGSFSCKLAELTTSFDGGRGIISGKMAITSGKVYKVSAYILVASSTSNQSGSVTDSKIRLQLRWYNTDDDLLGINNSNDLTVSVFNTWEKLEYSATSLANTTTVQIGIHGKETVNNNHSVFIDNVNLEEGEGTVGTQASSVLISEVAPGISGGDFIEFYLKEDFNLADAKVYEGTTLIKTFTNLGAKKGEYVVLHASKKGTDDTGDSLPVGKKYWEIYSDESSPGLTGTDNTITLQDSAGNIVDFISFANNDTAYSSTNMTVYNTAVSAGQWLPIPSAATADQYISGSVLWSESTKGSMARRLGTSGTEIGLPVDTNTNSDWVEQSVPNIGKGYGSVFQTEAKLEINQSPFSPYGDGVYTEAQLAYKVDSGYQVTIRVFDLTGRLVKMLVDKADSSATGASQSISWNGLDDGGNIAPVGIYIVNINALQKATGKSISESKTVVLGKRLK